jgi:hypothetical protein
MREGGEKEEKGKREGGEKEERGKREGGEKEERGLLLHFAGPVKNSDYIIIRLQESQYL